MPDSLLDARETQGSGGEPSHGQDPTEGDSQDGKRSGIRKLKDRLRDAIGAAELWKQKHDTLQGEISSVKDEIASLKRLRDPKGPEDFSETELMNAALSPEAEDIQARRALVHFVNKKVDGLEDRIASKFDEKVEDRFRSRDRQNHFASELNRLRERFGEDNLTPGSEMHNLASQYYEGLKQQAGTGKLTDSVSQILQLRAWELAGRDMEAVKEAEEAETEPKPEDRLESGSDSSGDLESYQQRREELLKQGPAGVKESIRNFVNRYYSE
jgi:hypothetical protein